ncbi:unnamed protein product [Gulo gulo]|uniref:Uncharacterized protein n=1 Tax=Gulo gulo TaxID=48420 RepID=A0A9X9LW65_GULGU|nr:unnamed protein product [Gulo gulo]
MRTTGGTCCHPQRMHAHTHIHRLHTTYRHVCSIEGIKIPSSSVFTVILPLNDALI